MPQKQHVMHGRDHVPSGADPIPGLVPAIGGDSLDAVIGNLAPDGWWKLNEPSGTIAHDSSGNAVDMDSGGWVAPIWAQPSGPPGQQTADFNTGSGTAGSGWARVDRAWAAISTDFTAGIWVKQPVHQYAPVFGQGNPERSSGSGWQLEINNSISPGDRPTIGVHGVGAIYALNPLAVNTWAFAASTYHASSGEWKLYVNGLLQGSMTGTYTPASLTDLWIGHDGAIGLPFGAQPSNCVLSYAFLINRTLSGAEIKQINDTTVPIDRTNYVLTVNSTGQQQWLPPTIEVQY